MPNPELGFDLIGANRHLPDRSHPLGLLVSSLIRHLKLWWLSVSHRGQPDKGGDLELL